MANWISQNIAPSTTARSRQRVAYLAGLRPEVVAITKEHLAKRPDADDFTLEVLGQLGPERLHEISGSGDIKRLRQDMGLLIAITLVEEYGADHVLTLRGPDGVAVSTRRNTREGVDWVSRYTPHRVLPMRPKADRILLDTDVVRKVIFGDPDALDLDALAEVRGDRLVSIADGALAELAAALLKDRIPFSKWVTQVTRFDVVLDPAAPIFPGGFELATLAGLRPAPPTFDPASALAYYRASWQMLRRARTKEDLERPGEYIDPGGRRVPLQLDSKHVAVLLDAAGAKWSAWVNDAGQQLRELRRNGDELDMEDLRELIRGFLGLDGMTGSALDKLDLAIRAIAVRTLQAGAAEPYNSKRRNDAIDFDLLFAAALPGLICTHDGRLVTLAQDTGSADASRVIHASELLGRLAA